MRFSLQTDPAGATPKPSGPTAELPSLGQPSRRRRSGATKAFVVALVIVAVGAGVVFGVPGMSKPMTSLFASAKSDMITAIVRSGRLAVIVKEKGNLESAANKDVQCEVEGGTTIIRILPEGTPVKAGDIVCELDSASLKDTLNNQKISTQQAEASFKQALLTREVAEYAVKEYVEGVFKQDLSTIEGQIALAKSDLERAVDRVEWSDKVKLLGYVSTAANIADHLSQDRAKFELEQSQTKKDVLLKYTKDKTVKELTSDVQKAKADELSKQSTFELEKTKEAKLERQIKACTLKAPGDGIVVYANEQGGRPGQTALAIEEGASVRERQKIFSLPDTTKMRVNTKVHESMVDRIKRDKRALVRVDAAANLELKGRVDSVAPMSDANSFFSSDIKVYTTFVAIEGDTAKLNLRPGMSAQVEILVDELPDVLSIPVQAILQFKGKDYAFIKEGESFRRSEIELGISNDQFVEIKKGLKANDLVAMTPNILLTEDERREAFSVAAKDAAKKDFGGEAAPKGDPAAPKGDPTAAPGEPAKAKAKGKRGGGGGGGGGGAMGALFQKISPEDRAKLRGATDEERTEILKKAGFTDEEMEQFQQMRRNMGGPGGPGGGGPGGGGGFGGGPGGPGQ